MLYNSTQSLLLTAIPHRDQYRALESGKAAEFSNVVRRHEEPAGEEYPVRYGRSSPRWFRRQAGSGIAK